MASEREEAAPTFSRWKIRLEQIDHADLPNEVARFVRILEAVGTPMIEGPDVHFVYYSPGATNVMLAGEFNQWGRPHGATAMEQIRNTGIFHHVLTFTEPVRLEYKLLVDGEWLDDPRCPNKIDNGVGSTNSYFVVGDFHEPAELQEVGGIPHGRIEEFEFKSERLGNTRGVYVYLPPAYDIGCISHFPTLFVHDGGEYLERAKLPTVLDNLIAAGSIPQLIAVMVDPVNRMVEYWANSVYTEFLCTELVPAMDARYRTIGDRKSRGVMGASLGGLISIYAAFSHPEVFAVIGGQSSALQLEEDQLIARLCNVKRASFRFYLDVGKYEPRFIPAHERLVALLKRKRWPTLYQELPGGHNWTSWRAHLKDLLAFQWSQRIDDKSSTSRTKSSSRIGPHADRRR
jgi:enterochelin esterase-like enzyme